MPYDGITAGCIAGELDSLLSGGRIEKVYQPGKDVIVLAARSGGRNFRLCLSASAQMPGLFITGRPFSNPENAPVFCMVLRKHIQSGKIIGVSAIKSERVIIIRVETIDELGDRCEKKLIAEIMGKHSNIILVNRDGRIIDAIKHIDSDISNVREVMPGRHYADPPSQDKTDLDDLIKNTPIIIPVGAGAGAGAGGISNALLGIIRGFSPQLCREACLKAGIDPGASASGLGPGELEKLTFVLARMADDIKDNKYNPCIVYGQDGKARDFHCLSMEKTASGNIKFFNTANEAADAYYTEKEFSDSINQKKGDLRHMVLRKKEKLEKKLQFLSEDIKEAESMEVFRLFGELITANIYRLKQGMDRVVAENYNSPEGETVEIPLDPRLSPQANAQAYFRKYEKSRNTIKIAGEKLLETRSEIEYLEKILYDIDESSTERDLDNIIRELETEGFLSDGRDGGKTSGKFGGKAGRKGSGRSSGKSSGKNDKRKKGDKQVDYQSQSGREYYISSDGYQIIAGKNNVQNDRLTLKEAAASDIWLHARNIPGAHVIIRKVHGQDVPESTIYEAAVIAAWNSRSKLSSTVPVDITEARNVRKPAGGRPGMVIYQKFRTMLVKPDGELAEKLIEKNND